MRKIKYALALNPDTFTPKEICKIRFENGDQVTVFERDLQEEKFLYLGKQFTVEELQKINSINRGLDDMGMVPMTLEEVDFMLNWNKIPEVKSADELQRLSGFVVEKTVKYLD